MTDDWEEDDMATLQDIRDRLAAIQQPPRVEMTHLPNHRAHPGWWAVDWVRQYNYPKHDVDQWLKDNCEGEWMHCPVSDARCLFALKDDALMCFMTFK